MQATAVNPLLSGRQAGIPAKPPKLSLPRKDAQPKAEQKSVLGSLNEAAEAIGAEPTKALPTDGPSKTGRALKTLGSMSLSAGKFIGKAAGETSRGIAKAFERLDGFD